MTDSDKYKSPEPTSGDTGHAVARSIIGAIPFAGAAGIELLGAIVRPPLERRREEVFEEMGEGLRKLEAERGLNLEDLQDNEVFIDVVIQATQAALRTSQKEKRTALRNAIMNSALADSLDESQQHFFIRLVDEFSARHLQVLKIFQNPMEWVRGRDASFRITTGDREGASLALKLAFPDLSDDGPYCAQIWKDLYIRGMVHEESLARRSGPAKDEITALANRFLQYIEEPEL